MPWASDERGPGQQGEHQLPVLGVEYRPTGYENVNHGRLYSLSTPGVQLLQYPWYDAKGNLRQLNDGRTNETSLFTYDELDRLTGASVSGARVPTARRTATMPWAALPPLLQERHGVCL